MSKKNDLGRRKRFHEYELRSKYNFYLPSFVSFFHGVRCLQLLSLPCFVGFQMVRGKGGEGKEGTKAESEEGEDEGIQLLIVLADVQYLNPLKSKKIKEREKTMA
jgi:hypothetical protein